MEMEEQKIETAEKEQGGMQVGEAMPVEMPAPAPMPTEVQQPVQNVPMAAPEVERMQMPMEPIDLTAQQNGAGQQSGMTMQMEAPAGGGNKKIMIVAGVVVVLLALGAGGFFMWKAGNTPTEETPTSGQAVVPTELPAGTTTESVIVPPAPQPDDISVIEQDLNTFNVDGVDAEMQGNLNEINASL